MSHSLVQDTLNFLGEATFRTAWSSYHDIPLGDGSSSPDDWVLKTVQIQWIEDYGRTREMEKEAIVLDQLSSSPRIVDIYGFCGQSSMVEIMPFEVIDEVHSDKSESKIRDMFEKAPSEFPVNNLSTLQVLDIAITMAESLADVHGFAGGVIVHGDVHPEQWLRNSGGKIKLNDFNNGFIMDWSYNKNAYCLESHGFKGTFLPTEVHMNRPEGDDRVDVYSMGSTIFTLLTGLYPYWQFNQKVRYQMITDGILPPIHPVYMQEGSIEAELVRIIKKCWTYKAKERPTIFEILDLLRYTIERVHKLEIKAVTRKGSTDSSIQMLP